MKSFWRAITQQSSSQQKSKRTISWPFLVIMSISFLLFGIIYRISSLLFDTNKIDIVKYNLWQIAQYVYTYDKTSSQIIARWDMIIQSALSGENVLTTQQNQIITLRDDIITHKSNLIATAGEKYTTILNFISDLRPFHEEIMKFLGKEQEQQYLIILQNSAEKRPNGWFFWSFAVITLYQWKIKNFHIIDSYLPQKYMSNIAIRLPEWSRKFYPLWTSSRIAANKFGFHDVDGKTLIALYNETFNQILSTKNIPQNLCRDLCNKQIQWVVFIDIHMLKQLAPTLEQKQREWQFVNATIDLIRWKDLPNKKEKYLSDASNFFEQEQDTMIKQFIHKFKEFTSTPTIGIYLPYASREFNAVLTRYNLTVLSEDKDLMQNNIFLRDTNTSFNKIDDFVTKTITIQDTIGDTIIESHDNTIPISWLAKGDYTITITYTIAVPESYKNYIFWLETQYGINMTDRERGILALEATDNYPDMITRLWSTRSHIYYPHTIDLSVVGWYGFGIEYATTPRGKIMQYKLETATNNDTKTIILKLRKY